MSIQILQSNSYPNIDLNYKILPNNNFKSKCSEFFFIQIAYQPTP